MTKKVGVKTEAEQTRRQLLIGGAALGATTLLGFPSILRAQTNQAIKIGVPTILSGRVAQLGISSRNAINLSFDKFNKAGGLNGRQVELIFRDSKGKPEEAARLARDMINTDGCDIILDAEASTTAFAVHEVVRDLGTPCVHTNSETSSLTADPKLRIPNAVRVCRQGAHDTIAGGFYAAKVAKDKGLKTWATVSPDYAYGRDMVQQFVKYLKKFNDQAEVKAEIWPKVFQPDYTEVITRVLKEKPDALFTALWGGDLVAFIDQANLYGLFKNIELFAINLGDYTTLTALTKLPVGAHSGNRYLANFPDTPENQAWADEYSKLYKDLPTNWSWQSAAGADYLIQAMRQTNSVDGKKLSEALIGMTMDSPFGANGKLTIRAEDHTLVNYAIGWGPLIAKAPYISDMTAVDWDVITELETEWKKEMGYI
ncbi:ABC transporter substrate-binding protein [Pollutimonas nitritireducens]|uniref:ABC transporter substrate-binding protein n=1 Tax=Pollutimonas nitritireducens TaxID=2045209 RepID=A0A2N4UB56_9BURK|nr:ABC transporter substrate-binding protein [Pollutimonas nitritireducens]PLC52261.1 ABC transporter substrate-binding protein [Pollutimonas nitritireducens]